MPEHTAGSLELTGQRRVATTWRICCSREAWLGQLRPSSFRFALIHASSALTVIAFLILYAQNASQPPRLTSPEVLADGKATFRPADTFR